MALAAVSVLALSGCSHEGTDWKSATAADTTESYQQFLRQHPNSANAVQAQARIEQLQEERDWQVASSADTRAAYEQFVAQHADGKWTQEARIRIENFAQSGAGQPGAAPAAAASAAAPAAAAGVATAVAGPFASEAAADGRRQRGHIGHVGHRVRAAWGVQQQGARAVAVEAAERALRA